MRALYTVYIYIYIYLVGTEVVCFYGGGTSCAFC